jgi:shikimate dehydrogenase
VAALSELGARLGIAVRTAAFEASVSGDVPLTIATLPGDAGIPDAAAAALAGAGGLLLDVVYGHWPTALSGAWERAGRTARSGLGMLLHQALLQIRIFSQGDPEAQLPDEDAVIDAMRRALQTPSAA